MSTFETPTPTLEEPPGFVFNPELLLDRDEQIERALRRMAYQAAPIPSLEDVPRVDVVPSFNPTEAPATEIYAFGRVPESFRTIGWTTRAEHTGSDEPVDMWRIVERSRVEDGSGLVSSKILQSNELGDVEGFDSVAHLASHHDKRMSEPDKATPFVSFSTDPEYLARTILSRGFGVGEGRNPIVVQTRVSPDRLLTNSQRKAEEVLLIGGVAPEEFVAAYEVSDFAANVLPEDQNITMLHGGVLTRDDALRYWNTPARVS